MTNTPLPQTDKLPHTATREPIKQAVAIDVWITMTDGQQIGSDHFNLKLINKVRPTEQEIIEAKTAYLKFVGYRNALKYIHSKVGEETYYQSLGIEKPYSNISKFKMYAETVVNYNDETKSFKPFFNEKFKALCRENSIVPFNLF